MTDSTVMRPIIVTATRARRKKGGLMPKASVARAAVWAADPCCDRRLRQSNVLIPEPFISSRRHHKTFRSALHMRSGKPRISSPVIDAEGLARSQPARTSQTRQCKAHIA